MQGFECIGCFAPNGRSVRLNDPHTKGGCRGYDDLVGVHQLIQGVGSFLGGDSFELAKREKMRSAGACIDLFICRMGDHGSVLQNEEIGVGAFGNDSIAMKDTFISACLLSCLLCQNVGEQIQGFCVTVQETGVLSCNTAQGAVGIADFPGPKHDREIGGNAFCGEGMGTEIGSAGKLEINPLIAVLQLFDQRVQKIGKLGF